MAVKLQKSKILASAIFSDNIRDAEKELQDGADPNLILPTEGIAPLHYAVGMSSQKSLIFTKMLLGYGADPNIRSVDGLTPVHVAATWGRYQALQYLLASGGDPSLRDEEGQTPLSMARSCDKWDCMDLLAQAEADQQEDPAVPDLDENSIVYTRLESSLFKNGNPMDTANSLLADISNSHDGLSDDYSDFQISGHADDRVSPEPCHPTTATDVTNSIVSDFGDDYDESTVDYDDNGISELDDHEVSEHGDFRTSEHEDYISTGPTSNHRLSECVDKTISFNNSFIAGSGDHDASGGVPRDLEVDLSHLHCIAGILKNKDDTRHRRKMRVSFFQSLPEDCKDLRLEGRGDVPLADGSRSSYGELTDGSRLSCGDRSLSSEHQKGFPPQEDSQLPDTDKLNYSRWDETRSFTIGDELSSQELTLLEGQGLDVTSPDNTVVFCKRASRDKRKTCLFELIGSPYLSPADCSIHSAEGDTSQTLREACTLLQNLKLDDDASRREALSRVKSISESQESGKHSATNSIHSDSLIPGDVPNLVSESSPCLSSETTPSRQSEDHVPRSEKKGRSSMFRHLSPVRNDSPGCEEDEGVKEYYYYDREADAHLIERNLPSANNSMMVSHQGHSMINDHLLQSANNSLAADSTRSSDETHVYDWKSFVSEEGEGEAPEAEPILEELNRLSNAGIQARLRGLGEEPGPVTGTTRRVYLILLTKLIRDPERSRLKDTAQNSPEFLFTFKAFKHELAQVLTGIRPMEDLSILEAEMVAQFQIPDPKRKWREGVLKSSFDYLLLDPRVSLNLPMRHTLLSQLERFRVFVSAIFYVGKGKRSRPYCHFYEALDEVKEGKGKKKGPGKKVKHIREIWSAGLGVISLHIFQNTIPVEAYTREACMVEALTLQRLTNIKKGDYYGVSSTWDTRKKRQMGIHLLQKACKIFLVEGERMIRPVDIKVGQ